MARSNDTIKFSLSAEDTVINTTVKIIANISALARDDLSDEKLTQSIREMMNAFIPAAKWQFSGMMRSSHATGREQIELVASARVSETENHALKKRSDNASSHYPDMAITRVQPDLSFPETLVYETENKLRLAIIEKAKKECSDISEAMGHQYRIGKINYATEIEQPMYANSRLSASASSMKTGYGTGFGPEGGEASTLGNAQKFVMTALVTLKLLNE